MWSTAHPLLQSLSVTSFDPCANSAFLRRHARRLLRAARAQQSSQSLPVLRRILAAGLMPELNLTDLYAVRASVQLKHVLHTLARELGFADWSMCKQQIDAAGHSVLDRYRFEQGLFSDFRQNWFADMAAALQWQREHGGYIVAYGTQAVAILAD